MARRRQTVRKVPGGSGADADRSLIDTWPLWRSTDLVLADRDVRRFDFVARHPAWLGIVDAGLALRDPESSLRWRLSVMTAILEATPEHAREFLPSARPPWYALYAAVIAVRAAVQGTIGVVVVTLIR